MTRMTKITRVTRITGVSRMTKITGMTRVIAHIFTVASENEVGVDLVLIRPFLLYYVNHVFLMLTSIF